eukprot:SAG11_NODE_7214_length_1176_cov_18.636955_2_plen_30_part_01
MIGERRGPLSESYQPYVTVLGEGGDIYYK